PEVVHHPHRLEPTALRGERVLKGAVEHLDGRRVAVAEAGNLETESSHTSDASASERASVRARAPRARRVTRALNGAAAGRGTPRARRGPSIRSPAQCS